MADRTAQVLEVLGGAARDIGQAYQEVGFGMPQIHDVDRAYLTRALSPQVAHYAEEGNWLKAVKRAYTVARMNGDVDALDDLAPLLSGEHARRGQVVAQLETIAEDVVSPGGGAVGSLSESEASAQLQRLAERVGQWDSEVAGNLGELTRSAGDVRGNGVLYRDIQSVLERLLADLEGDTAFAQDAARALSENGYLPSGMAAP